MPMLADPQNQLRRRMPMLADPPDQLRWMPMLADPPDQLRWAWWARQGLNLRPHPCEGCALPLSYAPMPAMERP